MYPLDFFKSKFNKYIIVGFFNTLFGYLLFSFLVFLNFDVKLALLFSYILGIMFNFITYKYLVFEVPFNVSRLVKYIIVYVVTYNINLHLLNYTFEIINNYYLSQILVLPLIIALTWFLLNTWVFKK